MNQQHCLNDENPKFPNEWDKVLCRYEGVYGWRVAVFWRDAGLFPHFGYPASEPASHWMELPPE